MTRQLMRLGVRIVVEAPGIGLAGYFEVRVIELVGVYVTQSYTLRWSRFCQEMSQFSDG